MTKKQYFMRLGIPLVCLLVIIVVMTSVRLVIQFRLDSGLNTAIIYGDENLTRQYLAKGANPNSFDGPGFVANQHFDDYVRCRYFSPPGTIHSVIFTVVNSGVEANRQTLAFRTATADVLPPVNPTGEHALSLLKALIEAGANVNTRDEAGRTPLMQAAKSSDKAMLMLLLSSGADPTLADRSGANVYSYCCDRTVIAALKHWHMSRAWPVSREATCTGTR